MMLTAAAALHGLILALGLILPLGVQNVFIFNQGALHQKYTRALPAVLAASVCDTVLIGLAVFGVSVLVLKIWWIKTLLMSAGVIFLAYMGWTTWKSASREEGNEPAAGDEARYPARKQIAFAASVSLLNPHAILDTVGVIGTSSLQYTGTHKWGFTLACILVSWVWFLGLAALGWLTGRASGSARFTAVLGKVSAIVMWLSAGYIVFSF
ncbi:LysE/ArgO family amino acid transporter [Paenibacillus sp. UNC499MF]|uniref:LysE/ArgO family amino acid transporter n=1 Tax=Paenibacillus sp. UNC499MF TaxID=1502751 RepID=UPI0008A0408B|nr:LysE family transporter [Paenibacillus sp. UNC499MF]SEG28535.1 L-lysine exporter family protein LysE/ArgO [Paenibacillus sp. UNC499MF]